MTNFLQEDPLCYSSATPNAPPARRRRNGWYGLRNIKEVNPTAEELRGWHSASGLPLKKFFNTSGLLYKELGLKDKLPTLTEEEQIALLSTDGMLVKRPMLIGDGFVLVGFKEDAWEKALL